MFQYMVQRMLYFVLYKFKFKIKLDYKLKINSLPRMIEIIFLVGCKTMLNILRHGVQHQIDANATYANMQPQYNA